jgi:hypothetical protein
MKNVTKAIVGVSLAAFALKTYELARHGKTGHGLPSAMQIALSTSSNAALVMGGGLQHFQSAITEAIYAGVADSKLLKNDGQQVLPIRLA